MNTNALAVMSLGLDQQVGACFEPLGLGERAILYLGYPLFGSISKELFGYISGLNIGKLESLKCATNFRLCNQYSGLAKVHSGYK
jgi:hypothetical protein